MSKLKQPLDLLAFDCDLTAEQVKRIKDGAHYALHVLVRLVDDEAQLQLPRGHQLLADAARLPWCRHIARVALPAL